MPSVPDVLLPSVKPDFRWGGFQKRGKTGRKKNRYVLTRSKYISDMLSGMPRFRTCLFRHAGGRYPGMFKHTTKHGWICVEAKQQYWLH